MATYSAQQIINSALTDLDMLEQGGTPSVSDSTDALFKLNTLIELWNDTDRLIWSVGQASYALSASTAIYQIGPTASAPFNVARPNYIESALISLQGPNSANPITHPLKLIGQPEYSLIRDLNATANIPERLYNDRASPNSTLYLWPVPRCAVSTNLILYTWAQLSSFAATTSTADLPNGYCEALSDALAFRLLPRYGVAVAPEVAQIVTQNAVLAEKAIVELNQRTRGMMIAPPQPQGAAA